MMSEELKPCPFCGGKITMTYSADGMASAWCKFCSYHGPEKDHSATAKQAWNTRVRPAAERTEEGEDEGEAWEPDEFSDGPYTNLSDGSMERAADIDAPEDGDMSLWYPREEWYPLLCAWRTMIEERDSLRAQVAKLTQERDQWKADCADRTSLLVDAQKQADLHWDTSAEEEVEL